MEAFRKLSKLIVIDGLDGSGKATQTEMLKSKLKSIGYSVESVSFPNYKSDTGRAVRRYLTEIPKCGEKELSTYGSSLLYSLDRFMAYNYDEYDKFNGDCDFLILDRYTSSNMVHQSTKFDTDMEKQEYFNWLTDIEYCKLRLPKPDITIYLDVPIDISQKLMEKRYNGDVSMQDLHERDIEYLRKCRNNVQKVKEYIEYTGSNFEIIKCAFVEKDEIKSAQEIHLEILDILIYNDILQ